MAKKIYAKTHYLRIKYVKITTFSASYYLLRHHNALIQFNYINLWPTKKTMAANSEKPYTAIRDI